MIIHSSFKYVGRLYHRLIKNTQGATTLEYVLLVVLIGLTIMVFLQSFGTSITSVFNDVNTAMDVVS